MSEDVAADVSTSTLCGAGAIALPYVAGKLFYTSCLVKTAADRRREMHG